MQATTQHGSRLFSEGAPVARPENKDQDFLVLENTKVYAGH